MWRLAPQIARNNQRQGFSRLIAASLAGRGDLPAGTSGRFFSGRDGEIGDEQDLKQLKTPSAEEMEFYSKLEDGFEEEDEEDKAARLDAEYRQKQEDIQLELDSRVGRPWTDPWAISEEQWTSTQSIDDLPDWAPEFVSRISQERVKLDPEGIPSLSALANMPLPPPACPHPGTGQAKAYANYRKKYNYNIIVGKVNELAKPKVDKIKVMTSWDEKQNAVDELFESVQSEIKSQEDILSMHPQFNKWVESAVEEYLKKAQSGEEETNVEKSDRKSQDEQSHPVFMDCFSSTEPDEMVPSILSPLKPHGKDGPGRMVEEWELSAHKKTKRILLRQCTRSIAETLTKEESSRILVHGRQGVGKSAVLASIVASARKSGYIVMYLPDGDRLRKNGFYVTPNTHREGMFDLQDLSQEVCAQLLASHSDDLQGMEADSSTMKKFFSEAQLARVTDYEGGNMSLLDLLKYAEERKPHAPMCYSVVVETLMNQEEKPFLMVMDEFNCFYDRGHYFHMAYDEDVREPIPYNKISLLEPALSAMALSADPNDDATDTPKVMKKGGIIAAVTESHAVPRKITDGLTTFAQSSTGLQMVEVPRFSDLEVDHILANFEATGVGNLRLDRGDTVMNEQEVAYLKMVSGSIGQRLLESSVL